MGVTPAIGEPESVEFTFEWYGRFLQWLLDHGFEPTAFEGGVADGEVLLRHDVDLSPRKALVMGRLEASLGVSSTYFFLASTPLYNLLDAPNREILAELSELGHRVALHFNSHQYWDAEPRGDTLRARVAENQSVLRAAAEESSETLSFHCPPQWALNRRFEGIRSTYEPRFFSEIAYWADSGQRWREEGVLTDRLPARLQLLTHPGLWGVADEQYIPRVMSETKTNLDRAEQVMVREMLQDDFGAIGYPFDDVSDGTGPIL